MKQCAFFYNGVPADGGGNFTLQPGVEPSACVLRFPLRERFDQFGSLTLSDRQSRITFSRCRLTRLVTTSGDQGRWQEVTIVDRRWAWSEGLYAIYGEYNRSNPGPYGIFNLRSARELVALLLRALGETVFDVSQVPATDFPEVAWDGANPADELNVLLQRYGCFVVLGINDRVFIARDGVGSPVRPESQQMDLSTAVEYPVVPRALVFEGGMTLLQHDLQLVPVGLELGGTQWKAIDDLSYKPAGGWSTQNPATFAGVLGAAENALARKHVWRRFAVSGKFSLPVPPQRIANRTNGGRLSIRQQAALRNYFTVDREAEWRILPLFSKQCPKIVNGSIVETEGEDAQVLGYYYQHNAANRNTDGHATLGDVLAANANADNPNKRIVDQPGTKLYQGGFTLHPELGQVEFAKPVFFKDAVDGIVAPLIRLRTAFGLRDPITKAYLCQQFWRLNNSPLAAPVVKLVKSSNVFFAMRSEDEYNERQFSLSASQAISETIAGQQFQFGASVPYKGFYFGRSPDGLAKAISWDVQETGGGTTHVDYGVERPEFYSVLSEIRTRRALQYNDFKMRELDRKRARGLLGGGS